jgi:hypothetical protein
MAADNYLPEGFFRNKPPINARDIRLYESFLDLLMDDTFERSFVEQKLSKDFKVKAERVRFVVAKITIIIILEVKKNDETVTQAYLDAYGPDALPTEYELAVVKPRLDYFASVINKLKVADVVELPYFYYIFML